MDKMGEGGRGRRCVAIFGDHAHPSVLQFALTVFVLSSSTRFTPDNSFALFAWFPTIMCPRLSPFCEDETGPEYLEARDDRTSSSGRIWTTLKYITTNLFYVINFNHTSSSPSYAYSSARTSATFFGFHPGYSLLSSSSRVPTKPPSVSHTHKRNDLKSPGFFLSASSRTSRGSCVTSTFLPSRFTKMLAISLDD